MGLGREGIDKLVVEDLERDVFANIVGIAANAQTVEVVSIDIHGRCDNGAAFAFHVGGRFHASVHYSSVYFDLQEDRCLFL